MGTLVTFYSYKGGVGRTMALANVAVLLAIWGKKVLVVDWDLEAPGIEHFLVKGADLAALQKHMGLIDLLTDISDALAPTVSEDVWRSMTTERRLKGVSNPISILTAGARTQGYFRNVRKLDVKTFYEDKNGGHIIEALRASWKSNFDFVLVDSRTGITDIGGICTIQLPDIIALVFTATEQSLVGAVDVAKKAAIERQKLPFDRSLVPAVPIPSRFDTQTEHEIAKDWLRRFEEVLEPLYRQWLPKDVSRREFLELTKIPYTPYFSFGEGLPVIEQGTNDPTGLGHAYETVAALIGNGLQHAGLLLQNRDEFVRIARSADYIPQTALRDLPLRSVLLLDLVASGKIVTGDRDKLLAKFYSVVSDFAEKEGAEIAMSTGDAVALAFSETEKAIKCALQIAEALAVRRPIVGTFGNLRIRTAIAAARITDRRSTTNTLIPVAAEIASKAQAGEILISGEARELVTGSLENVIFKERSEQLELRTDEESLRLDALYEVIRIIPITLTQQERDFLLAQDPKTKGGGGFQAFLVGLQQRVDEKTGRLDLTLTDLERIARYAHDYKGGGWQGRLRKIFGRTLGMNLGRETD
jgi:cellulose biosynthesis protein BcsQ/class 3 adenylate cyclase